VGTCRRLKVVVSSPVEVGGANVGPRRQLKVECGYGPSSPFESAGVGMGVRRCLGVLVQVWPSSPVEGGSGSMGACHCLKMLVQVWALVAVWSSWCGHGPSSSFGAAVVI